MNCLHASALAAVLAVGILFAPVMAKAQPKDKWVIGVLGLDSRPADCLDAFRETLRERGYLEGRNVTFQERWADSHSARLDELAVDLVRLKVDVIIVDGTLAALTAKRATREIPIVFPVAADPIGNGLVASLARPGGNATGLSVMVQELYPKRFELIRQMFPEVGRIALLTNLGNPGTVSATKEAEDAARSLKIDLRVFDARRQDEIEPAFAEMAKQRVGVLIITANGVFNSQLPRLFALTMKYRLPTMLAAISKHKDFLIEFGV
jgi:putative ABC transport system substrate-binding protein